MVRLTKRQAEAIDLHKNYELARAAYYLGMGDLQVQALVSSFNAGTYIDRIVETAATLGIPDDYQIVVLQPRGSLGDEDSKPLQLNERRTTPRNNDKDAFENRTLL